METLSKNHEEKEDSRLHAAEIQDEIRDKVKNWNGEEEIRKWRRRD